MLNNVCLLGRLAHDPELRKTQSNISVCSFTIANERAAKNGEEKVTDFIDIVAWRKTADFVCDWFKKGDPIVINGRIQTRMYTDQSGNKRKAVEILATGIDFAGGSRRDNSAAAAAPNNKNQVENEIIDITEDDLPFM